MLTILSIYPFAGVELESIPQNCMQLVKVFDVKGSFARLARFYRDDNGTWHPNSEVWSVNIGKNGIEKESESDGKKQTAGCIAMTKKEMMEFVKWLDPKKSPAVLIVK